MHVNKVTPLMKMAYLSPKDTFSQVYQSPHDDDDDDDDDELEFNDASTLLGH